MKIIVSLITVATALAVSERTARSTESSTTELFEAAREAFAEAHASAERVASVRENELKVLEESQRLQQQALLAQLAQNGGGYATKAVPAPPAPPGVPVAPRYVDQLQLWSVRPGSGSPGNALVIRTGDADPAAQETLEEDLAVMSHLLGKATDEVQGGSGRGRTAMGIDVWTGSNPVRSFYLDDYGVVFVLHVNFPLLAPPKSSEAPKEKTATDSSWEEARQELYGGPRETAVGPAAGEDYDADKVELLKNALVGAFKSATNIRNLKADDWLTVTVIGGTGPLKGPRRRPSVVRIVPDNDGETPQKASAGVTIAQDRRTRQKVVATTDTDNASGRGTVLTIRVKKADADSYAKGKLSAEEFRKRMNITAYRGGPDSGGPAGKTYSFDEAVKNFEALVR
jgi:hypothetical protein